MSVSSRVGDPAGTSFYHYFVLLGLEETPLGEGGRALGGSKGLLASGRRSMYSTLGGCSKGNQS